LSYAEKTVETKWITMLSEVRNGLQTATIALSEFIDYTKNYITSGKWLKQ
jgi:hypothetical protein